MAGVPDIVVPGLGRRTLQIAKADIVAALACRFGEA